MAPIKKKKRLNAKFTAGFTVRFRSDATQNFRPSACDMKYIVFFMYVVIRKKYSPFVAVLVNERHRD